MKARRALTAAFLITFILSVAICQIFGPQIRDALSNNVNYIFPENRIIDGLMVFSVPAEAVHYDELGNSYVLAANVSEKYPERCYVAQRCDVMIYNIDDDVILISAGVKTGDRIIVDENVIDGERVIALQNNDY